MLGKWGRDSNLNVCEDWFIRQCIRAIDTLLLPAVKLYIHKKLILHLFSLNKRSYELFKKII